MKTLKQYIYEAEKNKQAIGHFNVANSDMIQAVFSAARVVSREKEELIPVVIGVSEGERDAIGVRQSALYIQSLREQYQYPIFINADHTYSVERCKEAIDAGFDMVIYDGAHLSYEENLANTKIVVDYAHAVSPHILVEAELGFIGSGSNIKDELPEGVSEATMTQPSEAQTFVSETGLDLLAPSVGNVHGMIKSGNPRLNPERINAVRESGGIPLVLHGGSGSTDGDFIAAIDAGISMIHISTELRKVLRFALDASLLDDPAQLAPYKYMKAPIEALQKVVEDRIRLFTRMS